MAEVLFGHSLENMAQTYDLGHKSLKLSLELSSGSFYFPTIFRANTLY